MLRALSRTIAYQSSLIKNFHISATSRVRQIFVEKPDEKTTVIDCKYIKSPREPYLLEPHKKSDKCPLCTLKLDLKYTDVLIIGQYIDVNGKLLAFKETNLCYQQYSLVKRLIYMAQYAGLLPEPPREEPRKPYLLLNTYYDETTINVRPKYKKRNLRFYYLEKKLAPIEKFRINPNVGFYYGRQVH